MLVRPVNTSLGASWRRLADHCIQAAGRVLYPAANLAQIAKINMLLISLSFLLSVGRIARVSLARSAAAPAAAGCPSVTSSRSQLSISFGMLLIHSALISNGMSPSSEKL